MIRRVIFGIFDLFIPPRASERIVAALSIEALRGMPAARAGAGFSALLPYHDPRVMALVWELKYRKSERAAALAAALLLEPLSSVCEEELSAPLLLPMPMHPARRKERGFNQTEVLCEAVLRAQRRSGAMGALIYAPDTLVRVRYTKPQQGLPRAERLRNVAHSMDIKNPTELLGRACVVVDDVATTGATLEEARRALLSAGARSVHCIALAA